jgi:hypothetical protein
MEGQIPRKTVFEFQIGQPSRVDGNHVGFHQYQYDGTGESVDGMCEKLANEVWISGHTHQCVFGSICKIEGIDVECSACDEQSTLGLDPVDEGIFGQEHREREGLNDKGCRVYVDFWVEN